MNTHEAGQDSRNEAQLDPDNWLEIPEFDVLPADVDFKGFGTPILSPLKSPYTDDELHHCVRDMVKALRIKAREQFGTLTVLKSTYMLAVAPFVEALEYQKVDESETKYEQYAGYDGDTYEDRRQTGLEKERIAIANMTAKDFGSFAYELTIRSFKKALITEGEEKAVAIANGALHLIDWLTARQTVSASLIEQAIRDYKTSVSRRAAEQRHKENRQMRDEAYEWLELNRKNYPSMDQTAEALCKIFPIRVRTARAWVGDWKSLPVAGVLLDGKLTETPNAAADKASD